MYILIITVVILVLYILPLIYNKWWTKQAYYSKMGRWTTLTPNYNDAFFIFFPLANLVVFYVNLGDSPYVDNGLTLGPESLPYIQKEKDCTFIEWFVKL